MKRKIISDVWYQWLNEERTEVEIFIADEDGDEFSIAQINVEDYPQEIRFEEDKYLEQNENEIYELACEVAYDLGYELQADAE